MKDEKLLALIAKIEKFFGKKISEIISLLKKGQLRIAIEGTDSSGKATQAALLCSLLNKLGAKSKVVSFPDYQQPSCSLVEHYLSGHFPRDLNPKTVATFFAVDRSVKLQKEQEELKEFDVVIYDRYTMSNAIHQGLGYEGQDKVDFLQWVVKMEYEMLGIPKEDLTIFLDMPLEFSLMLLKDRTGKEGIQNDIHENAEHLTKAYENAKFVSQYFGFKTVKCVNNPFEVTHSNIKTREDISEEVLMLVLEKLVNERV